MKINITVLLLCYHSSSSEGVMIFPPNLAENSGEKYEGQWKDGKMAGYGKLRWMYLNDYVK